MHDLKQEIHRLQLQLTAARSTTTTTTTTAPTPLIQPQPQQLRSLDKEGALNQENELLRQQLSKTTQEHQQLSHQLADVETTNKHLNAKLQLFRIELHRKDTEQGRAPQKQFDPSSTPPTSTVTKENVRLRQMVAERNELTVHLKTDLEGLVQERQVLIHTIDQLHQDLHRLQTQVRKSHPYKQEYHKVDPEDLTVNESSAFGEEGEEPVPGIMDLWAEVLWGK